MPDRRSLLVTVAGVAGIGLTGCLGLAPGRSDATPESCTVESPPPMPTDAAAEPKRYPDKPTSLSAGSVERFVADYEPAYRYNEALAASPDLVGRTNEITVEVDSVTADRRNGGFSVEVTGEQESDFLDPTPRAETPETATRTPLPAGHGPFETRYIVTERHVERDGVTVECW